MKNLVFRKNSIRLSFPKIHGTVVRNYLIPNRFEACLIHDWDSIFAKHMDEWIKALGLNVLKSPPRCSRATATCERVIGKIRRECLLADPDI